MLSEMLQNPKSFVIHSGTEQTLRDGRPTPEETSLKMAQVKLATEVFRSSVTDPLDDCNKRLPLPQCSGCEETMDFLRTIDGAFGVLGSRTVRIKHTEFQ